MRKTTRSLSTQTRTSAQKIANTLEKLRARAGLTESQWLRVLGCSRTEYEGYQSGKRMPLVTVVAHAALFSGLTFTKVYQGKI